MTKAEARALLATACEGVDVMRVGPKVLTRTDSRFNLIGLPRYRSGIGDYAHNGFERRQRRTGPVVNASCYAEAGEITIL
jgi:hypothetical protein